MRVLQLTTYLPTRRDCYSSPSSLRSPAQSHLTVIMYLSEPALKRMLPSRKRQPARTGLQSWRGALLRSEARRKPIAFIVAASTTDLAFRQPAVSQVFATVAQSRQNIEGKARLVLTACAPRS